MTSARSRSPATPAKQEGEPSGTAEVFVAIIIGIIPSLPVGHLAGKWQRSRGCDGFSNVHRLAVRPRRALMSVGVSRPARPHRGLGLTRAIERRERTSRRDRPSTQGTQAAVTFGWRQHRCRSEGAVQGGASTGGLGAGGLDCGLHLCCRQQWCQINNQGVSNA